MDQSLHVFNNFQRISDLLISGFVLSLLSRQALWQMACQTRAHQPGSAQFSQPFHA
jgi:hypothetical protein